MTLKSTFIIVGVPVDADPLPKIEALHRRIHRILAEMPEDYIYRTTLEGILRIEFKARSGPRLTDFDRPWINLEFVKVRIPQTFNNLVVI